MFKVHLTSTDIKDISARIKDYVMRCKEGDVAGFLADMSKKEGVNTVRLNLEDMTAGPGGLTLIMSVPEDATWN